MTSQPITITITITDVERRLLCRGLYDKLFETKRYLSPHTDTYPQATPLDTCCDLHLARYESRREEHQHLTVRKRQIEALIVLLEDAAAHDDSRSSPQEEIKEP